MGRWRFVLVHGVLKMGLGFAVLMLLVRHGMNAAQDLPAGSLGSEAGRFALEAILFGGMMGLWEWRVRERRYLHGDDES